MHKFITGKTRFRPLALPDKAAGDRVLLVLQLEERLGNSPLSAWRDAMVEDITNSSIEVRVSSEVSA